MSIDANQDTLLEFPCRFPIKTFGKKDSPVREVTLAAVHKYLDNSEPLEITEKPSRNGNYVGITVTFTATSKPQLDNIYQLLSTDDAITMAL